jgi:Tfp pilus assembly protein PilF
LGGKGRSRDKKPSRAKKAALKALSLDNLIAEAHTSLARIRDIYENDRSGAEEEFKRAIEINPGYPTARHWYSRHLLQMGRLDESIAEGRGAGTRSSVSISIRAWAKFFTTHAGMTSR